MEILGSRNNQASWSLVINTAPFAPCTADHGGSAFETPEVESHNAEEETRYRFMGIFESG